VNNRTQAIICDDLSMTQYVINNDQTVKERIDNEHNKVKDKADIIEGTFLTFLSVLEQVQGLVLDWSGTLTIDIITFIVSLLATFRQHWTFSIRQNRHIYIHVF